MSFKSHILPLLVFCLLSQWQVEGKPVIVLEEIPEAEGRPDVVIIGGAAYLTEEV